MIVAGIGMRANAPWQEIVELVLQAAANAALTATDIAQLATLDSRADEPGFAAAAEHLNLPTIAVPAGSLPTVAGAVRTRSPRVEALHGVGSIAEACALAAAGQNPRLLLARISSARVTCAIARGEGS